MARSAPRPYSRPCWKRRGSAVPDAAEEFHELINDVTSQAGLALLDRFVSALTGMSVEELVEAAAG